MFNVECDRQMQLLSLTLPPKNKINNFKKIKKHGFSR